MKGLKSFQRRENFMLRVTFAVFAVVKPRFEQPIMPAPPVNLSQGAIFRENPLTKAILSTRFIARTAESNVILVSL